MYDFLTEEPPRALRRRSVETASESETFLTLFGVLGVFVFAGFSFLAVGNLGVLLDFSGLLFLACL